MGAFLSALFAIQWPSYVDKLILVDPWGVPRKPPEDPANPPSLLIRTLRYVGSIMTPFTILRAAGPLGISLVQRFRPDLSNKFAAHFGSPQAMESYVYHCNVQPPSGEVAFAVPVSSSFPR